MIKSLTTNILSTLARATKWSLDTLFPKYCFGCAKEGAFVCAKCLKEIVSVNMQVCPQCGRLSDSGRFCDKCKKGKALSGVIAALYFDEGPVKEMIHNFKYNSILEMGEVFAQHMMQVISNEIREISNKKLISNPSYLITYTPLHYFRFIQRGYNQSKILAELISSKLNIPAYDLLIKTKHTKRQVQLHGDQRRENLQEVFKVKKSVKSIGVLTRGNSFGIIKSLKGKTIILVDDVCTTTSTLNECARVLKAAGAKEVWGLVVARG